MSLHTQLAFETFVPPRWWQGRLCAFDTETTGRVPTRDRLVSACVARVGGGQPAVVRTWLVRPATRIPQAATAVHGITDAEARAHGEDPREALESIAAALQAAWDAGEPLVAYNARFDLTLMACELERHGLPPLRGGPVIDPSVLDRQVDRTRQGSRRLSAVCAHHRVPLHVAHRADQDALATARLAYVLGRDFPAIGSLTLAELCAQQRAWDAEQRLARLERKRRERGTARTQPGGTKVASVRGSAAAQDVCGPVTPAPVRASAAVAAVRKSPVLAALLAGSPAGSGDVAPAAR